MTTSIRAAVGVMAKAPVPGHCKTRMCPPLSPQQAAQLHEALLLDTLDAVRALPGVTPVLFAAPELDGVVALQALAPSWKVLPQRGDGLGPRMEDALEALLQLAPVAFLLGADAPHAPLGDALRHAAWVAQAPATRVVMGPSDDGGYWTIGMGQVHLPLLRNMPWSTPQVAALTRQHTRAAGLELVECAGAMDVDDLAGLQALARTMTTEKTPRTGALLQVPGMREIVTAVG